MLHTHHGLVSSLALFNPGRAVDYWVFIKFLDAYGPCVPSHFPLFDLSLVFVDQPAAFWSSGLPCMGMIQLKGEEIQSRFYHGGS
jgi:hypothetical protein